jgi:hypothetical protein
VITAHKEDHLSRIRTNKHQINLLKCEDHHWKFCDNLAKCEMCILGAIGWIQAEMWVFLQVYIYNNLMVKIVRMNSLVG